MQTYSGEVVVADSAWTVVLDDADVRILRGPHVELIQPDDGVAQLAAALRAMPPQVGLIGAKRLAPDGKLFSMGEFVIHPKGYHRLGEGLPATTYRFVEEVDAVTGGLVAVRSHLADSEQDDLMHVCLRLRRDGHRVAVVPQVVATDVSQPAVDDAQFRAAWGFDWRAADLDAVARTHAGTGLLWNLRFHGRAMPFEKYVERPAVHWANYQNVEVYRKRADHLAKVVLSMVAQSGPRVVDLGCGDGLFSHLFASGGATVTAIDPELVAVEQARAMCAKQQYRNTAPTFAVGFGDRLDMADGGSNVVAMLDVIEHLPNPVAVLREVSRILAPNGALVVSTPAWQFGAASDATYHVTEYTGPELIRQIEAATPLRVQHTGTIGGVYRDLIVVARKAK